MLELLYGISLVTLNRVLLRLGFRKPRDGWRRGAGLVLKGEAARFVLSAFSLDIFSNESSNEDKTAQEVQQHISKRLARFLESESELSFQIRHEIEEHVAVPHPMPHYTLGFEPWAEGPQRFIRPDAWAGTFGSPEMPDTSPLLEFICRINADRRADLWVRINHVGADGVPVQEMLSRLEKAWDVGPIVVPSSTEFEPHAGPRSSPGREQTAEVQTFIEFGSLLDWRKRENAKLPEPMTFAAALIWRLARHPVFSSLYVGTTVELPRKDKIARGVGMLVIRPADYFNRLDGLSLYVKTFNRQLELTRRRKSSSCKTLDAAAFLPAKLEKALLRGAMDQGTTAFGSLGLTILKDAKVFGAPLGDAGHVNGFIAVGSVTLQTSDGKRVGCVVVKGPREQIALYAKVLKDAIERLEPK